MRVQLPGQSVATLGIRLTYTTLCPSKSARDSTYLTPTLNMPSHCRDENLVVATSSPAETMVAKAPSASCLRSRLDRLDGPQFDTGSLQRGIFGALFKEAISSRDSNMNKNCDSGSKWRPLCCIGTPMTPVNGIVLLRVKGATSILGQYLAKPDSLSLHGPSMLQCIPVRQCAYGDP
ncbi:hypothetical protein BKA93DRAFT_65306 [Sparassis latifolia]